MTAGAAGWLIPPGPARSVSSKDIAWAIMKEASVYLLVGFLLADTRSGNNDAMTPEGFIRSILRR